MNQNRPVTSKARGICRYYNHPRGCYAGDRCKFLHADPAQHSEDSKPLLTPYDQAKRCKFYVRGFCKRGEKCWFIHGAGLDDVPERDDCSICFEKPATYGLLSGCSHIFCIGCIRQWREVRTTFGDPAENVKKCPMCRITSEFTTPSSKFWKEGDEGKANAIKAYKESMSRVSCKYFQLSKTKNPSRPACPFGKDCFYQHLNDDGTNHVFMDGIDVSMRKYNSGRSPPSIGGFNIEFGIPMGGIDHANEGEMDAVNLAGNIAIDMFDRMVAETRGSGIAGGRGRGRTNSGRRGIDEATLDRARFQMVAGAMVAIRAELGRLEEGLPGRHGADANHGATESSGGRGRRPGGANSRPVIVPGTLAPSLWDLDVMDGMPSENDDVRGGWGWNNLFSDIGIGADGGDAAVLERLEILAEHMLASLQSMGQEDESEGSGGGNTAPLPPLEPFLPGRDSSTSAEDNLRSGTLPPPHGSVNRTSQSRDHGRLDIHTDELSGDDDDLPSLESVSNSSANEAEQSFFDEGGEEVQQRLGQTVRAFDLAFRRSRGMGASPEHTSSWPLFRFWGGARRLADTAISDDRGEDSGDADVPPTVTSSQRFSTVVGRDEERMIINVDDSDDGEDTADFSSDCNHNDQVDSDANAPASHVSPTISQEPQDPPFMTDGRGRVIWSNSGTNKTDAVGLAVIPSSPPVARAPSPTPPEAGSDDVRPTPEPPRSLIGRVIDAFF